MPRTSKSDAPVTLDIPLVTLREAELGGYAVQFLNFHTDSDPAPLFKGLPDDRCQCPHWGYMLSGKVIFRYSDHDETYVAGDAYYAAPGHLPLVFEGTEAVEFSPASELARTSAAIGANMAADAVDHATTS